MKLRAIAFAGGMALAPMSAWAQAVTSPTNGFDMPVALTANTPIIIAWPASALGWSRICNNSSVVVNITRNVLIGPTLTFGAAGADPLQAYSCEEFQQGVSIPSSKVWAVSAATANMSVTLQ